MTITLRRAALVGLLFTATLDPAFLRAQERSPSTAPLLTPEQMEDFLLNAKIVTTRGVSVGINNTRRATLSDGALTHDAHVQIVDVSRPVFVPQKGPTEVNFRDTYRYNIAGYRLAKLLGLDNVPMSVERNFQGRSAAITWWIDDVLMDEGKRKGKPVPGWPPTKIAGYIHVMRVFDELIANNDRNAGNMLWTTDGKLWLIDHTRAFRLHSDVRRPKLLERIDRDLFAAMKALTRESLTRIVGGTLTRYEVEALLERRDGIVALFTEKIAERGEAAILYSLER